jgi:hypothetical protein
MQVRTQRTPRKQEGIFSFLARFAVQIVFGFTNLAPMIPAITMKNNTATPPHIPATVNDAASPFNPTSSFSKTFCLSIKQEMHQCRNLASASLDSPFALYALRRF